VALHRKGSLAALRELALLWLADKVDEGLQQYMDDHGITAAWETRERVVVALTGAPGGDHLIRRAARMATRAKGDLLGVHVRAGIVDPETLNIDFAALAPVGRLCGNMYARQRDMFELKRVTYAEWRKGRGKSGV